MKFPSRPKQHVTESDSWKVFEKCIPPHWIPRKLSGRDYGIDCYIELVTDDGQVTGDLVSVQLKGGRGLKWREGKAGPPATATLSGIKTTTVNYWMRLPMPVFLCVADGQTRTLYFAPVKQQVRTRYDAFAKQKTFSFRFDERFYLPDEQGRHCFLQCYSAERSHSRFSYGVETLLTSCQHYAHFIGENLYRDPFLEVGPDRQLVLVHMYHTCEFVAKYLGLGWSVTPLRQAAKEDKETWKEPSISVHEMTLGKLLKEIGPLLPSLLNKVQELVTIRQKHYWKTKHPVLFYSCLTREFRDMISSLAKIPYNLDSV